MLKLNLKKKSFNKQLFLADVKTSAKQLSHKALENFLQTLVEEIPVWSGAAKATLIPLARLVKKTVSISPKVFPPFADPNEHGISAGIKAGDSYHINRSWEFGFVFSHSLMHYFVNEHFLQNFGPTAKPTPWETLKRASESWTIFMRDNSPNFLRDVRDYIEDKK